MDNTTLAYALHVLDAQKRNVKKFSSAAQRDRQQAYYDGMRRMLEIILTDGYTNDSVFLTCQGGQHLVKRHN